MVQYQVWGPKGDPNLRETYDTRKEAEEYRRYGFDHPARYYVVETIDPSELPEAERRYYDHTCKLWQMEFDDTPLKTLERLVEESRQLRHSKVIFPKTDETLIRTLEDHNQHERPLNTFGDVAREYESFYMIDIEDGHYRGGESREAARFLGSE